MLCNLYVFPKYLNDLRSVNGLSRVMYCVVMFSTCFDTCCPFVTCIFQMNGKDLPFMPPKRGDLFSVPNGIRPVMQRTAIEV